MSWSLSPGSDTQQILTFALMMLLPRKFQLKSPLPWRFKHLLVVGKQKGNWFDQAKTNENNIWRFLLCRKVQRKNKRNWTTLETPKTTNSLPYVENLAYPTYSLSPLVEYMPGSCTQSMWTWYRQPHDCKKHGG